MIKRTKNFGSGNSGFDGFPISLKHEKTTTTYHKFRVQNGKPEGGEIAKD